MRRALTIVAVSIAALLVILEVAIHLVNADKFRPIIQARLQTALKRPVTLGQLHLQLFPFAVKVDGITVGQSSAFSSPIPFATAKVVSIKAGLFSLFGNNPDITALTLQQPQLELIRNASGVWNFADLEQLAADPSPASNSTQLRLNKVEIDDGQIAVTDLQSRTPRTVYNHIDLTAKDLAPGQPFSFHFAAAFPGPGKHSVAISGKAGPFQSSGAMPVAALNVQLKTTDVPIAGLLQLANLFVSDAAPVNADINGTVSADLSVQGTTAAPVVNGHLAAPTLQAQQITLTDVSATLSLSNGTARLSPFTAGLFGGTASGLVNVDTRPAQPTCATHLKFSGVETNALLSAVSSAGGVLYGSLAGDADLTFVLEKSSNLAQTLNGTLAFSVTNGQLKNINLLSDIKTVSSLLGTAPVPVNSGGSTTLQRLSANWHVQNGVATTNNLAAAIPEGNLTGAGSVNLANQNVNMRLNASVDNIAVPVLLSGNLASPRVTPDTGGVARSVLGNILSGQMPNQQKNSPQPSVNSILKGLLKKK